jgi:hypothetical protein
MASLYFLSFVSFRPSARCFRSALLGAAALGFAEADDEGPPLADCAGAEPEAGALALFGALVEGVAFVSPGSEARTRGAASA